MSTPVRVLIVDDREDHALLMVRELRRANFEPTFERVFTEQAMSDELGNRDWDVVLCDHTMPEFDSFAALKLLHENGLDLPFIIVSGTIGEDVAVAAMKSGAHDFILKRNLTRLGAAVERELREAQVRRKNREATEQGQVLHQELEDSNRQAELLQREPAALGQSVGELFGGDARSRAADLAQHLSEATAETGEAELIGYSLKAGLESLAGYRYEEALAIFSEG